MSNDIMFQIHLRKSEFPYSTFKVEPFERNNTETARLLLKRVRICNSSNSGSLFINCVDQQFPSNINTTSTENGIASVHVMKGMQLLRVLNVISGVDFYFITTGLILVVSCGSILNDDSLVKKSYRNYKVIRTQPVDNPVTIKRLMKFDEIQADVSFWKYPALNQSTDIMTSPDKLFSVGKFLNNLGLGHITIVDDVEALFENQNDVSLNSKETTSSMSWDRYHSYYVIMDYAEELGETNSKVSYKSIGTSSEGREIGLVTISTGGSNKPAIFMDGGMHAREWISPAAVTYIMHQLITNKSYEDLIKSFDWYIVPIVNVDGYEYSRTSDRMWRKTRSRHHAPYCIGVDPNRNWGYEWGGKGASKKPCDPTYRGPRAFSEPETEAVANAILDRRDQIKMYLSFHSYSQLWLMPWAYTKRRIADYDDLYNLANTGASALSRTYGTEYTVGSAAEVLYEAAGGSHDWAKGVAGIKYSYTLELRDKGTYGFALPASQIKPTGEETMNGVAAIARMLRKTLEYEKFRT